MTAAVLTRGCQTPECDGKHAARGYCKRCYARLRAQGKFTTGPITKIANKSRDDERRSVVKSYVRALTCYRLASSVAARMTWRDTMQKLEAVAHESDMTMEVLRQAAKALLVELANRTEEGESDGREE